MASDSPPFTPIRPNPYIVGTPVRDRTMFFGREAEFELVRRRFAESTHGGLLVFCGERRSGKTSILFQILDRRLGHEFIPVLIDMQSMAVSNEIDFLDKVSREVLAALGPAAGIAPPEFREDSNHSATFRAFIQRVLDAQPHQKLILLFDEYELFENKIDAGTLNQDVLYVLANLMEHEPVFLVFTGSQHLEARRAEYWKILGKSLYKTISYLERNDALSLIQDPVRGRLAYEGDTIDRIVRLTAGQPFYTQAICQSLVDHANEERASLAGDRMLADVVQDLVENPLPQMIFLWDGLDRDEKLVLAVLAETLADGNADANVADLARSIAKRDYPLELSRAQIATALEKLFQSEMLLKNDRRDPPGYAFRMDLWRLWIRRMHSVWQVMREEGLAIPRGRRVVSRRVVFAGLAVIAAIGLASALPGWWRGRHPAAIATDASGPSASFTLQVVPDDAAIYQDGHRVGIGSVDGRIVADTTHRFRAAAAGFADSEFTVRVPAGGSIQKQVSLRPLLGDLSVTTSPPGADVRVDGVLRGKSPITIRGLPTSRPATIEASLPGFGAAQTSYRVAAGGASNVSLTLVPGAAELIVTTDPPSAELHVDRVARGVTPQRMKLSFGRHTIAASREGFLPAETTLVVAEGVRQVELALRSAPPGVLVVLGDRPAQIYLNGSLIVENVQNSGPRELTPGTHQVRVVLVSGETIDQAVTIHSGERTTYDYSKGTTIRGSR